VDYEQGGGLEKEVVTAKATGRQSTSIPLADIANAHVSRLDGERTAVLVAVLVPVIAIGPWFLLVMSAGL
jgi:hypothetical protein